jgi:hypothetical protein
MEKEYFFKGKTPSEFLESFKENRARVEQFIQESELDEDQYNQLKRLSRIKYVLVIAEPWSGDVMYNLPPLLKMAEAANWEVRIFNRDLYPDLILPYRKEGLYLSIPVFAFYDKDFNELAHWVERPALATRVMDAEQLKLRRRLREENKEEWRIETFKEIVNLVNPLG